jgi:hypothetical protein
MKAKFYTGKGEMESQTKTLLKKSAEDEQTMGLAGLPPTQFGFHAQQAVEKLLKALSSERRISYPWTHNLKDLIQITNEFRRNASSDAAGDYGANRVCQCLAI